MRLVQRWTWALLATLIALSIVFLVALPVWGDGGHHPDCERYPQKCNTTTTTTVVTTTTQPPSTTTTTLPEEPSTTTTAPLATTTSLLSETTTTTPASTTTVLIESTTQPPATTDPTVAPADAVLPVTGLSHDVWAGLTFAGFVLLTMGGMAVLAGRDDE